MFRESRDSGRVRRKLRPEGFTLFELLIGMALSALIATLILEILRPATFIWKNAEARSMLQQNGTKILNRMQSEILQSIPSSLSISQNGFAFLGAKHNSPVGDDGELNLADSFTLYCYGNGTITRKTWNGSNPAFSGDPFRNVPQKLSSGEIQVLCDRSGGVMLSNSVSSFSAVANGETLSVKFQLSQTIEKRNVTAEFQSNFLPLSGYTN